MLHIRPTKKLLYHKIIIYIMKQELTLENLLYGLRCPSTRVRRETWEYFCRHYGDDSVCRIDNIDFSQTDCWGNPVYSLAELYSEFFLVANNYRDDKHCCHFFQMLEKDNSALATEHLINLTTRGIYPEYQKQILSILQNRKYDCADSLLLMLDNLRLTNEKIFLPIIIANISNFDLTVSQVRQVCNILNNKLLSQEKYLHFGWDLLKSLKITQDETTMEKLVLLWKSIRIGYFNSEGETPEYLELFSQMICEHCLNAANIMWVFSHNDSILNNPYISVDSKVEIIQHFINKYTGKTEKARLAQYQTETSLIKNVCRWIDKQLTETLKDIKIAYLLPLCEQLEQVAPGHLKIDVFNIVSKILLVQFQTQHFYNKNMSKLRWKDTLPMNNIVQEYTGKYMDLISKLLQNCSAIICSEIDSTEFLHMCRFFSYHSQKTMNDLSKQWLLIYLSNFNTLRCCLDDLNNNVLGWQVEFVFCDSLVGLNIEHQYFPYSQMLQFLYHMAYENEVTLKEKILTALNRLSAAHGDKMQVGEKEILQHLKNLYDKNEDDVDVSHYLYLQKVLKF